MIKFNRHALHNLNFSLKREWFESNARGCMAYQSILGINTRNNHGLFILRKDNEPELIHLVANLEETVVINGFSYSISSAQYRDQIYPAGYKLLSEFRLDTHPEFLFDIHGLRMKKEIVIPGGTNAVIFKYTLGNMSPNMRVNFVVKPFFTFKFLNEIKRKDATMAGDAYDENDKILYKPYSETAGVYFSLSNGQFINSPLWYYNFFHALNTGGQAVEDYYNPGFYELKIENEKEFYFIISETGIASEEAPILFKKEIEKRKKKYISFPGNKLPDSLTQHYILEKEKGDFFLESPMHNFVDFLSTFMALPALSGIISLKRYQRILDGIVDVKTKDLLPDIYRFSNHTKLYETPLPNLFFLIFSFRKMQYFPAGVPRVVFDKDLTFDFLQPYLKNKFQRIQLKSNGWLKYKKNEQPYIWYFPFSIRHFNCSLPIGEIFLNVLWYNALEIFLENFPQKVPFKFSKLQKYKEGLKKKLHNISTKGDESLIISAILLALPFRPLPNVEYEKYWHFIKKNMSEFGPVVHSSDKMKTFALPVVFYLSLFHLVNSDSAHSGLIAEVKKILISMTNHAYDGCIEHFSQSFEMANGAVRKMGNTQSGLNMAYYLFWKKLSDIIQKKD